MSFAEEQMAIESRLKTNWGTRTPIQFPGVNYTPRQGVSYIALDVISGESKAVSIGSTQKNYRNSGFIFITIYAPEGKGYYSLKGHADAVAEIFRGVSFNGINCMAPSIVRLDPQNGWLRLGVNIYFYRDEIL